MEPNQSFQRIWLSKISSTAFISMMRLLLPVPVSMHHLISISGIIESIIKKTSVSEVLTTISSCERLACRVWRIILVSASWWLLVSSWIFSVVFWVILNTSCRYVAYSSMFPSKLPSDFHSLTMNCVNLFLFEFDDSKRFVYLIWDVVNIWLSISSPWLLRFLPASLIELSK